MEHLIIDLKELLVLRKSNELNRMKGLEMNTDKDLLLISTGKVFELDFLIKALDEMLNYHNKTKSIKK